MVGLLQHGDRFLDKEVATAGQRTWVVDGPPGATGVLSGPAAAENGGLHYGLLMK